jgi:hypothetical protein
MSLQSKSKAAWDTDSWLLRHKWGLTSSQIMCASLLQQADVPVYMGGGSMRQRKLLDKSKKVWTSVKPQVQACSYTYERLKTAVMLLRATGQ